MEREVAASTATNMLGPYLLTEATCPFCGTDNILRHQEGYGSGVAKVDVCSHLRAMRWDDDGTRHVVFSGDPPTTEATDGESR